jgi:hypothetical protein
LDAGLSQGVHERLGRPVEPRRFSGIEFHEAIINAQTRQSSQDVFDEGDLGATTAQGRSPLRGGDLVNLGRDFDHRAKIRAHKDDPGRRRGRDKTEAHRGTG